MNEHLKRMVSRLLIFTFMIFLIPSDSFPKRSDEKKGLKLIQDAELSFINYDYQESINKFNEALKLVKSEKNLSRLYLGLSRSYYAMGLMERVKEAINKLAVLTVRSSINENEYPRGYLKIYNEILTEIERRKREEKIVKSEEVPEQINQVEKTGEETQTISEPEKQTERKDLTTGVIEKPGKKKKKKKSFLLPILGGAAALGALAVLLGGKKSEENGSGNTGSGVSVVTRPEGAAVYVDGNLQSQTTNAEIYVSPGEHTVRVVMEGWGEASTTHNFDPNNGYIMEVNLPAYKMVETGSFDIDSTVYYGDWDFGVDGRFFTVGTQNGKYHFHRYRDDFSEDYSEILSTNNGPVSEYIVVMFDEIDNQLYVYNQNDNYLYIYDWDGNLISSHSGVVPSGIQAFDSHRDGNIYFINQDRSAVGILSKTDISYGGWIVSESNNFYFGLVCSPTMNDRIYIATNYNTNSIRATQTGGSGQLWWDLENSDGLRVGGAISAGLIVENVEKVYVEASVSDFSTSALEVYGIWDTNDMQVAHLTGTASYPRISKIVAGEGGTVYMETTKNHIVRLEPIGALESEGEWTITPVAPNNTRFGTSGSSGSATFRPGSHSNKRDRNKKRQKKIVK